MDYRIPEFSGDRHQVSRRARAKQHARGFEGIFETLVEEHTEAAMMLDVLCRTTDAKQRAALWPKLRRALLSHDQDEVRILCPDLHELVETRRLAQRHDVEARDLESMIRRLDGRAFDHPEWLASALTLRQLVVRHIREEENELFPTAQRALGAARAAELKEAYCRTKAKGGSRSTLASGLLGGTQ